MINQSTDQIGMTLAANIEATIGAISADLSRDIQPKRRGIMKLLKLRLLTVAAAALVIGAGTTARAFLQINDVTDGTYTFRATDGNTQLDGSWVAFQGDLITNWELLDSFYTGPFLFEVKGGSDLPPLNPTNSRVFEFHTYPTTLGGNGPDGFSFRIDGLVGDPIFSFSGQNNVNTMSILDDGYAPDPVGTWTWSPTSVPDASGTFGLLVVALTALGTWKSFLRRRA